MLKCTIFICFAILQSNISFYVFVSFRWNCSLFLLLFSLNSLEHISIVLNRIVHFTTLFLHIISIETSQFYSHRWTSKWNGFSSLLEIRFRFVWMFIAHDEWNVCDFISDTFFLPEICWSWKENKYRKIRRKKTLVVDKYTIYLLIIVEIRVLKGTGYSTINIEIKTCERSLAPNSPLKRNSSLRWIVFNFDSFYLSLSITL